MCSFFSFFFIVVPNLSGQIEGGQPWYHLHLGGHPNYLLKYQKKNIGKKLDCHYNTLSKDLLREVIHPKTVS